MSGQLEFCNMFRNGDQFWRNTSGVDKIHPGSLLSNTHTLVCDDNHLDHHFAVNDIVILGGDGYMIRKKHPIRLDHIGCFPGVGLRRVDFVVRELLKQDDEVFFRFTKSLHVAVNPSALHLTHTKAIVFSHPSSAYNSLAKTCVGDVLNLSGDLFEITSRHRGDQLRPLEGNRASVPVPKTSPAIEEYALIISHSREMNRTS
jgi:hypothetical protein